MKTEIGNRKRAVRLAKKLYGQAAMIVKTDVGFMVFDGVKYLNDPFDLGALTTQLRFVELTREVKETVDDRLCGLLNIEGV